ncbi:unnamed protein product [Pedinophyceae sp. YPF-701]|nr:unnamed protein product [Pedinophyceae sp. YPF-701]
MGPNRRGSKAGRSVPATSERLQLNGRTRGAGRPTGLFQAGQQANQLTLQNFLGQKRAAPAGRLPQGGNAPASPSPPQAAATEGVSTRAQARAAQPSVPEPPARPAPDASPADESDLGFDPQPASERPEWEILPGGRAKWGVNFPTWWVMNFGWHLLSGALDGGHMAKPIRLEYFTAYKGIPGVMLGPSLEHMYANGEGVDWEHCPSMKLGRTVRFPKLTPKQLMEIHPVVFFEPAIFFYKIPSCRVVECPGCGGRATSKGPNYGLHKRVFDIDRSLITFSREWLCNASETNELTGKPGCGYAFNLTNPGYIGKLPPAARSAYDNVVLRDKNSVTRDTMDLISRIGAGTSMLKVERFLKDATITRYLRLRLWLTEIQITNAMCAGHDGNSLSDVHKYFEAMDELVVDKSCISARHKFSRESIAQMRAQRKAAGRRRPAAAARAATEPRAPAPEVAAAPLPPQTKNGVDALMRFAEPLPNDPLREDFGVGHRSPQHSMEFLADAYTTWQVRDLAAKGDEIPARLHNALLDLAGIPPGKPLFDLPVAAYVDVEVHNPDGRCGATAQTLLASTVAEMENDLAWIRGETIDFAFYSLYNEMEDEWGQHRAGGQQLLHDVLLVSTNALVNLMCHYDTREFPEYQVATDNTRKFVRQRWFSAEILAAFGYRRRARTAAVDPATGQPMIDAHRVILPVNASAQPGGSCQNGRRNHWYTVVVDNVEGSITILDTLRRMYVKHHEWMMSILPVFLNDIRADARLPARRWTTVVPQNYPTQGNYYDCGAHVLQMAECYARGLVLLPAMQAPRHAGPEQQLPKLASHRQLVDFVNREGAQAARRAVRRRIVEQFRRSLRNKDPTALQAMLVLSERAKAQHGNDAVRAREVLVNVAGDDVLRAQPLADILAAAKAQGRQQRIAELRRAIPKIRDPRHERARPAAGSKGTASDSDTPPELASGGGAGHPPAPPAAEAADSDAEDDDGGGAPPLVPAPDDEDFARARKDVVDRAVIDRAEAVFVERMSQFDFYGAEGDGEPKPTPEAPPASSAPVHPLSRRGLRAQAQEHAAAQRHRGRHRAAHAEQPAAAPRVKSEAPAAGPDAGARDEATGARTGPVQTRLLHHWYSAFDMEQMSEFADKEGYDGKFLSYGAIMGRYLEEFLRLEPFMNCVLDSVCAESYVLRGDTTFKVAKGIHLGGGRVCDGMYLVLNEIGQVVAYNFVTSESDAAMQPILQSLATRLKYFRALEGKEGDGIKAFYDDLCCLRDKPILAAFPDLKLVRVDLWHAMNRVLRKTKSSHPLFKTFSGMFALCFLEYDQGDLEKYKSYIDAEAQRTTVSRRAKLPQPGTPLSKLPYYKHCRRHCRARVRPPEEIERCLESLVREMEERAAGGEPIIQSDSGDGVKHNREAIDNLLEHVRRGCLQDWSGRLEDMYTVDPGKHRCGLPQYLALRGSGYNEALHHRLNQVMPSNHNSMLFTHAKMLTSITMWNKEKADKHTEGAVLPTTDLTTVHDINHLEARIYGQAPYAHVVRADPEAPHGSHGFGEHFKVFGTRGEGLTTPEHMAMINMQDKLDNVPADSARYTAMSASSSHVCDEELSLDTAGIGSLDADFQAVNSQYHAKKKEVADALAAQEGPKGARTLVGHSLKRKRPAPDEDDQGGGIVTRGAAKKTKGEKKRGGTRYKSGKGSSRAVRRTPGVVRRAGAYREEKMGEGVPAAMKGQIGLRPKDPRRDPKAVSREEHLMTLCLQAERNNTRRAMQLYNAYALHRADNPVESEPGGLLLRDEIDFVRLAALIKERNNMQACLHTSNPGLVIDEMKACVGLGASTIRHGESRTVPARIIAAGGPGAYPSGVPCSANWYAGVLETERGRDFKRQAVAKRAKRKGDPQRCMWCRKQVVNGDHVMCRSALGLGNPWIKGIAGKNRERKVAEFQAYLRGKIDALSERQRDVLARAPGGLPAQAQGDAGVVAAQAEPVEQKPPVE